MIKETQIEIISEKYNSLENILNERQKRIWAATEVNSLGRGGLVIVVEATKLDHKTIQRGLKELQEEDKLDFKRIRKEGGGRKSITDKEPGICKKIESIIEADTRGDPESPLKWTSKSTRKIEKELKNSYKVSQKTIYNLLTNNLEYSLQSNKKTLEGKSHEDRDAQFHFINDKVKEFQNTKNPCISVDTKKKENIGNYKNNGKEYAKKGTPIEVNGHDFPNKKLGKVAPYGIYDITKNNGFVNVGISSDTAQFAVNSIRNWWNNMGKPIYKKSKKILITADCGGSNGNRTKLWKIELQKLSNEIQKEIHVCHFPPGTSKWNKIEHRMFSFISKNWRGKPLLTRQTVVNLIGNTTTTKGLEIQAMLDENEYMKAIKVSDKELQKVNLHKEDFHGEWNYKIAPQ